LLKYRLTRFIVTPEYHLAGGQAIDALQVRRRVRRRTMVGYKSL
jgi:hypothetical protein